jgi:hypothetical protein
MGNNETTLSDAVGWICGAAFFVGALSLGWFDCGGEEPQVNVNDHIYSVVADMETRIEQLEEETDALIDAVDELTPRSRRQSRESNDAELEELDRQLGLIEPFVY